MLLRSSSAPILSSLLHYSKDSSPEPEPILKLPRAISFLSLSQKNLDIDPHNNTSSPKKKCCVPHGKITKSQLGTKIKEKDDEVRKFPQEKSCTGENPSSIQGLICGGGCNGRGSDGGGHGRRKGFDSEGNNNDGRDRTEAYYQSMIETYPNDALLLGNYATFLKEVCGDYPRAKEFLERAILATPGGSGDGHVLSLYADLVWQTEKNPDRAEGYFGQAIQSAPDDCYVMASYAKFLWEAEEDDDKDSQINSNDSYIHPHDPDHHLFQGTNHHSQLTAAS